MIEFNTKLKEARQRLPLRRLMEQHGKGAPDGKWGSGFKCPWCSGNAGVFTPSGGEAPEMFKCQFVPCPTENKAFEEIGFLQFELKLSREEAWKTYFKEAGVWQETEAYAPSVLPGSSKRHFKPPEGGEDEGLVQECIEVIRTEGRASVTLLQRRLRLGYTRAARIVDELEKRGMVGPARGSEPREILKLPEKSGTSPQSSPPIGGGEEQHLPSTESAPSTSAPIGPSPEPPAAAGQESSSGAGEAVIPGTPPRAAATDAAPGDVPPVPIPGTAANLELPSGRGEGPEAPSPALAALRWFYDRLELLESDLDELWDKRGLRTETCQALGFRSNRKCNKELLQVMEKDFPINVLLDSGLWNQGEKPTDPPKPNPQFYGMALVERRDEKGKKARDRDGDVVVDCVWRDPGPILIPYFNERGIWCICVRTRG